MRTEIIKIFKKYKVSFSESDSDKNLISKLKNSNEIDWGLISINQKLSEGFIREFKNKVYWYNISIYQKLSEDFIKEFKNKVDWENISAYQKLSEDFIREFKDKVDWPQITAYQKLSEEFIREFKDKVDWLYISKYQKLSEDFIKEFKNKVHWNSILKHQKLSESFIKEPKKEIYSNKKETKMSKVKELPGSVLKANQSAAKTALSMEVGRTGTKIIKSQLLEAFNLPPGLEDNKLIDLAIANLAFVIQQTFVSQNQYAEVLTQAMVQTAMLELVRDLQLPEMIDNVVKQIGVEKIKGLVSKEE